MTPKAPDFCAVAKAYGLQASRPASLDAFAKALKTAKASGEPFLIDFDEQFGWLSIFLAKRRRERVRQPGISGEGANSCQSGYRFLTTVKASRKASSACSSPFLAKDSSRQRRDTPCLSRPWQRRDS